VHAPLELRSVNSFSVSTIIPRSPASSRASVIIPSRLRPPRSFATRPPGGQGIEPVAAEEHVESLEVGAQAALREMRAVAFEDVDRVSSAAGEAGHERFERVEVVAAEARRNLPRLR